MSKTLCAGVFIINKNNEVLICHPTNHPDDVWSIPKGKIEKGETKIDAAIRETFEETNIDLTDATNFLEMDEQVYSHKKKSIFPFVMFEKKNPKIDLSKVELKCNSNVPEEKGGFPEMDDYKWTSLEEASQLLHDTQVRCLPQIQKLLSNDTRLTRSTT